VTIKSERDKLAFFRNKCKEHGMRVTHQKVMIYQSLLGSQDHPSPEKIYDKLKNTLHGLSLDTVYRTLSAFEKIGLIDLVQGYGTARRFDPMLEKHHHFHCRQCGTIIDFTSDYYDKMAVPSDISRQCKVIKLQVTIEGLCKKCLKKRKRSNSQ
jgi:Fur family peroxide stress response transcriptional regulator